MDLDEFITLTSQNGVIQLPLKNLLRLTIVYLTKMLPEYYAETKSDSLKDFLTWIEPRLGLQKGDSVLL